MDNIQFNVFNLPDDVVIEIFNYLDDPSLRQVSTQFKSIFDEEFSTQLFNSYQSQPFLKKIVNQIKEAHPEYDSFEKVRDLYTQIFQSVKEEETGQKIKKETFQKYGTALSADRLNDVAKQIQIIEATEFVDFFDFLKNEFPEFKKFAKNLEKDPLLRAEGYRNWMNAHRDEIARVVTINKNNHVFQHVPKEIGWFTGLEVLTIKDCKVKSLPSEIEQLTRLRVLELGENAIKQLPPEIEKLTNLRELDLSYNALTELPATICHLKNLENLTLTHNRLMQLPEDIGNIANLRQLALGENQIQNLPHSIGALEQLRGLILRENPISQWPEDIPKPPQAEIIL